MIPKKIHYCWFGGKSLNKLGKKCLKSWKKFFPDYEIIEWNESNFDIKCCRYVEEAYEAQKYAFVSDYVRFKILYEQGGVYFDTDVQVIKSFDKILLNGNFMGCENSDTQKKAVNPGLGLAAVSGLRFYKEIIDEYEKSSFYLEDGSLNLYTIVERTTDLLYKHGLQDTEDIQEVADIKIYPCEFFGPINMDTGKLRITENTCSIHKFAASWVDHKSKIRGRIYRMICRLFGKNVAEKVRAIFGKKH